MQFLAFSDYWPIQVPTCGFFSIHALEQLKAQEALPQLKMLTQDGETIHFDGLGTVREAATAAIAKLNAMQ